MVWIAIYCNATLLGVIYTLFCPKQNRETQGRLEKWQNLKYFGCLRHDNAPKIKYNVCT